MINYADGEGIRFQSPGWTEFATDGATLALHGAERPGEEQDDPEQLPPGDGAVRGSPFPTSTCSIAG